MNKTERETEKKTTQEDRGRARKSEEERGRARKSEQERARARKSEEERGERAKNEKTRMRPKNEKNGKKLRNSVKFGVLAMVWILGYFVFPPSHFFSFSPCHCSFSPSHFS